MHPTDEPRTSRGVALEVLHRVDAGGAWSGVLLRRLLDGAALSPPDAALATALVYGTLRHRAEVDWALSRWVRGSLADLPSRIRTVLRLGAYQLLFLRQIPPHAACSEAVALAKRVGHPGTVRLVNAVLRRVAASPDARPASGDTPDEVALSYSHPAWLVARWVGRWGVDETRALCAADNDTPPSAIRLNTLRGEPRAVARVLEQRGIRTAASAFLPEGRRIVAGAAAGAGERPSARRTAYEEGWFSPQDEGAMLVARLVSPRPGETVIDACAAPGGKTTHLAALMEDRGRVIACDVHPAKLRAAERQCTRLGVSIVETRLLDAGRLGTACAGVADRVLVDAPCSGLGVLRRRPEIRWRLRPDDLAPLAAGQGRLLDSAAGAVRPGGRLVYSVCSAEPEEGREVVAEFLAAHHEFEAAPIEGWPPGGEDGSPPAAGVVWDRPGTALLLPHRCGTDGFFVASLRRAR